MLRKILLKSLISFIIASQILNIAVFAEVGTKSVSVSAECAVLIDAGSGQVVYEKNADKKQSMASTTKIMTALVALENGDIDGKVRFPKEAVGVEGSSIYAVANEEFTLRELLYALMLRSANDAAAAIAIVVGGSIEGFADMMNEKAAELGLENTHFDNPHGLDSKEHYTTAKDLAKIAAAALKNELFKEIVGTKKYTISLNGEESKRLLVNHNRLLKSYDGCIGVKTGFTKKSGRCLVSAAQREGLTLICVTLNAPDDWNDHRKMLDYGFSLIENKSFDGRSVSGLVPVVGGNAEYIQYAGCGQVSFTLKKGQGEIKTAVELRSFYYAPVNEGDVIGRIVYTLNGNELGSLPIKAVSQVQKKKAKRTFWQWLLSLFS